MVPYVRKSFYKHFMDGIKYCEGRPDQIYEMLESNFGLSAYDNTMSIEHDAYKMCRNAYQYAMDMTIKECQQAVEGMYHNLNY